MMRCAFQIDDEEPQVFTCDGFLMMPVQKKAEDHLSVQPVVMGLTYDQIARTLIATNVSVWGQYVDKETC